MFLLKDSQVGNLKTDFRTGSKMVRGGRGSCRAVVFIGESRFRQPLARSLNCRTRFASLPVLAMMILAAMTAYTDGNSNLIPDYFKTLADECAETRLAQRQDGEDWTSFRHRLLQRHAEALGVPFLHAPEPIVYETIETLQRDGYSLKKIVFESVPQVPIPAHLYMPGNLNAPAPGILCVHGHWPDAKCAPQVHARAVFLAKRGFVVLALDAIGAGERAYQGITYHGRQLGYQAFPTGQTLAGLQIEDNRRAIDLLASLPEVDPDRIGVTGASGGGNQTFHLTIMEPRIRAAVGVCFFGAYEGYTHGAHCSCETIPGVLTYAEEGLLAGLVAPRAFAIFAAQEDHGAAFRIEDARRNADRAREIYEEVSAGDNFRFVEFAGGHDYSRDMREIMVGFFEQHLMGRDPVERVPEPELDLLEPEQLKVFKDGVLPDGALYVPQIVARQATRLCTQADRQFKTRSNERLKQSTREKLRKDVFGGFSEPAVYKIRDAEPSRTESRLGTLKQKLITTEPGIELPLQILDKNPDRRNCVLLILGNLPDDYELPDGNSPALCIFEPRGIGSTTWDKAAAVDCDDYLLTQGSAVLGKPILGRWVLDTFQVIAYLRDEYEGEEIKLWGEGIMGLTAVLCGLIDGDCAAVGTCNTLASYNWPDRFEDCWGLAHFVPGIMTCGDIPHFMSLLQPGRLVIGSPKNGGGAVLDADELKEFEIRIRAYSTPDIWPELSILTQAGAAETLDNLIRE